VTRLTDQEWEEIWRGLSCAAIDKPGSNAYRFSEDARSARAAEARLRKALVAAESALSDMMGAFDWGSIGAVNAGVSRCRIARDAVRIALEETK
jgi:hypothetical protein